MVLAEVLLMLESRALDFVGSSQLVLFAASHTENFWHAPRRFAAWIQKLLARLAYYRIFVEKRERQVIFQKKNFTKMKRRGGRTKNLT